LIKIVTENEIVNFAKLYKIKSRKMNVSINKMVILSYVLRAEGKEGDVIEQTTIESPLRFVFGLGQMLPMFESNLSGLKQGDDFEMTITASDAYGEIDEDAIVDLPKEVFLIDGYFDEERFTPGNQVPMQTSNGQRMNGTILELNETSLKMDFNHPLAGINLHFTGNIIEVRDATEDELMPAGCGCSCGSANDGCGSGSCSSDGCGEDGCGC
jgi:FKBP-type peptidyl-prolyl cis-trans isomerase SlyD